MKTSGKKDVMTDDINTVIEKRKTVINTFKEDLIRRLNLPYKPEDLHEDVSLLGAGLGLDSLDVLEIVLCVENSFGIKIPDESTSVLRSINTVVDFIIKEKEKKGEEQ
jgi:acyl carrier protein